MTPPRCPSCGTPLQEEASYRYSCPAGCYHGDSLELAQMQGETREERGE